MLAQTHVNFEWILINDGSNDNTEDIIQSYKDSRIQYYKHDRRGQSAASNVGLSIAKGEYIKFFDADDIMCINHLEEQLEAIGGRADVLASCKWGRFYNNDPLSATIIAESVWQNLSALDWIKNSLQQRSDMMPAWLWLIPREAILASGGFDERLTLNNDFEFSMRLLLHAREVRFAQRATIFYRSGHKSLSSQHTLIDYKAAVLSTDLGCGYLLSREDSVQTRQLCADRYQEWLYRVYPLDENLEKLLEARIQFYGGSKRKISGGLIFRLFSFFIGWKNTKKLKKFLSVLGYRKLPIRISFYLLYA